MKLHRRLFASVLILMLSPMAANAVPIAYDWTGNATRSGWTATGEVVIDDSDFGSVLNGNTDFISWVFQWTDGVDTFAVDNTTGSFVLFDTFATDAAGVVTAWDLCATTLVSCGNSGHPAITTRIDAWAGTATPFTDTRFGTATVGAGTMVVAQVPLPGTLMLLGAGFIALGIRRGQTRTINRRNTLSRNGTFQG